MREGGGGNRGEEHVKKKVDPGATELACGAGGKPDVCRPRRNASNKMEAESPNKTPREQ